MKERLTPKYVRLRREILLWLDTGSLRPHDRMPSENEIAEQFGMSRQTVRQTLGELEKEGRLYRVQGKGTFVAAADAMAGRETQTIGMLTTYISDYIFPHIVRGAEAALRSKGYRLLLSSTDNDKERERESLAMMMSQPLSGLIVEPTKSAEGNPNMEYYLALDYRQIPYLMINERYPELSCPCLKLDDEAAGYAAAEHLIGLGHRAVAGFFKTDDLQGVNRLKGFMRAHREHRLPLQPGRVVSYTTEDKDKLPIQRATALLEAGAERPTAFVCYNDELAVRMLEVARRAGIEVPRGLSLIGCDDSTLATATEIKLTTLAHPKAEMGEDAAQLLIDMIEGKSGGGAGAGKLYRPELRIRESTVRL